MISNSRSTVRRNQRSASYSPNERPAQRTWMLRPASTTSSSSFFVCAFIHQASRRFDLATEVRIANRLLRDEIDAPSEQLFERISKVENTVRIASGRSPVVHRYEKIEITAIGVEPLRRGGAEDVQASDAEATAEFDDGFPALFDEVEHAA